MPARTRIVEPRRVLERSRDRDTACRDAIRRVPALSSCSRRSCNSSICRCDQPAIHDRRRGHMRSCARGARTDSLISSAASAAAFRRSAMCSARFNPGDYQPDEIRDMNLHHRSCGDRDVDIRLMRRLPKPRPKSVAVSLHLRRRRWGWQPAYRAAAAASPARRAVSFAARRMALSRLELPALSSARSPDTPPPLQ